MCVYFAFFQQSFNTNGILYTVLVNQKKGETKETKQKEMISDFILFLLNFYLIAGGLQTISSLFN